MQYTAPGNLFQNWFGGCAPTAYATLSYPFGIAGVHNVTAVYGGDANNLASTSAAVVQTVAATPITLTVSPNPLVAGQPAVLTTTVTGNSPGGTITFMDGAAILGTATLAAGQATLSQTFHWAGTRDLTASYSGDANNQPSRRI